ncbi:hypothetical protein OQJ15_16725 [Fluoribacter dumoffii]|uniref:hypothetical protein n=1 Tax=Fluoribacter dumoffii TaxID=463 RepID=UPI002242DCD4|nr:hypothetical protein [Fluoribacter dumoffii]MCW8387956.1 hypothetical protein [Fluoribacter dumoffii]MCW8496926.1 hypothetical protein [Fluoribacter dumoffii]
MGDINSENFDLNRSIVEFQVCYTTSIHTTGRKKGQKKTEKEIIAIIVPSLDQHYVQDYIQKYCRKKNMELINFDIQPLPKKRFFEFNCQICEELSINLNPMNQKFCSKYCQRNSYS